MEKLLLQQRLGILRNEIKMANKGWEMLGNLPPIAAAPATFHQNVSREREYGEVTAEAVEVRDWEMFGRWTHVSR